MSTKVKRISNIELLRIIAMIMIIMHHFALHGCSQLQRGYTFNTVVIDVFILGGKVGVDLFILISGYFMVDSKITMRKILKFVGQVWFYSISIFSLFYIIITPNAGLSYLDGVHFFFPNIIWRKLVCINIFLAYVKYTIIELCYKSIE